MDILNDILKAVSSQLHALFPVIPIFAENVPQELPEPAIIISYVAGAWAGVDLTASLTNAAYIGAVDVPTRYSTSELIDILNDGHIVFVPGHQGDNTVTILRDINTLTSFTADRPYAFSKGRIIRTLDTISDMIMRKAYLS